MSDPNNKDDFQWEEGQVLNDKNIAPNPEIRAKGLPKLNTAVHADPVARKEARDKKILNVQSKPYHLRVKNRKEDNVILDENQSGLNTEIEESEAKKYLDKGPKFKGLDRFGDKNKNKNKENE